MSFRVVRNSKFRHVFGAPLKREQCYDNIRVSKSTWDATFCAVNPKFLAIITEQAGGGAFIILPLHKVGRIERDYPLVAGHKGPVLDIAWCPFNDNVIASGSEDCIVKVWQIPDVGLTRTLTEPVVDLVLHQRRVVQVLWHPTANNILLSSGGDNKIIIWNVGTGEALVEMECHPDVLYSCCFNFNGSKLITACKDKKLRVVNPRTGEVNREAIGHEGSKPMKALYLKNGLVFTTGFSRMSERQYSLRDEDHLGEPIVMVELDTSNGVMFPLYDPDVNLMYLCGKGDSVIRYFEITDEPPFVHYINTFQSPEPQRGIGMMPKRGCEVNVCEIARFFRLHTKGYCEVISMTVPRKSELFQDDLYPDTVGDVPSVSAEEWFMGKEGEPIMVSLKGGFVPSKQMDLKVTKKSNVLDKMPNRPPVAPTTATSAAATTAAATAAAAAVAAKLESKMEEMAEDVKRLKVTVLKQEARIRDLERKVAEHEGGPPPSHPHLTSAAAAIAAKATAAANTAPTVTNNGNNNGNGNNNSNSGNAVSHNATGDHEMAPDEV